MSGSIGEVRDFHPLTEVPTYIKDASQLTCIELMEYYWQVSRCWQDPRRAVRENMTVERALLTLREVKLAATAKAGGRRLIEMATMLTAEIVLKQPPVASVEAG